MFQIHNLAELRVTWLAIQGPDYVLYGCLLYSNTDTVMINYMTEGIFELDSIFGHECAIFIIESPSKRWMEWTKGKNHRWWKLMSSNGHAAFPESDRHVEEENQDAIIRELLDQSDSISVNIDAIEQKTLRHVLSPNYELPYDRLEIFEIARSFQIPLDRIPCITFFRDPDSSRLWYFPMTAITTVDETKRFFRRLCECPSFKGLLQEARANAR